MLKHLSIHNFALIRELDVDFTNGLHIITGETGAGKSILLGALGLILGERADTKALLQGTDKCVVEATFDVTGYDLQPFFTENDLDYQELTLVRREINSQGKSRAFINDTPVSLNELKTLGESLVDLHSQHEHLTLNDKKFQAKLLDTFAGTTQLTAEYRTHFIAYTHLQKELQQLQEKETQLRTDYDYHLFLWKELEEARLKEQEQEELELEQHALQHADEISQGALSGAELLKNGEMSLNDQLASLQARLATLGRIDNRFAELARRTESMRIELADIADELEHIADHTQHNEARLQEVDDRLHLIYQLQKKHRAGTVAELLEIAAALHEKTADVESLDERMEQLSRQLVTAEAGLKKLAEKLSEKRQAAAPKLSREIDALLAEVGMPNARIQLAVLPLGHYAELGMDDIQLLFASNAGSTFLPLYKIASGGELSRLMLSVKSMMASNNALPTLIFDEIDTGISGEVAQKVGRLMKKLATGHQVISVTHLPQIAGAGAHHYFVYKTVAGGKTQTHLRKLSEDERVEEIAKMLSGDKPSASALENARELLAYS